MGRLIYGSHERSFDIDDRLLAHLRVVFMNKLRRAESFMFHHTHTSGDGIGTSSLWIHPSVPLVLHFYGSREPALNRTWIEALMQQASGSSGLVVTAEPDADVSGTPGRPPQ